MLISLINISIFKPLEDFNRQFSEKITKGYLGVGWAWVGYHANISDKYIHIQTFGRLQPSIFSENNQGLPGRGLGVGWAWVGYHANISDKYIHSNLWKTFTVNFLRNAENLVPP